jgi:electron transfer flavoprotein alpha subunit
MTTLVIAEHRQRVIRPVSFELISATRELEGEVVVLVIGPDAVRLGAQLRLDGVDKVIAVPGAEADYESDVYLAVAEQVVREEHPDLVLAGHTADGLGFAPGLAARLGAGFASDVFRLRLDDGALVATRGLFRGSVHADLEFPQRETVVVLVRPGAFAGAAEPASVPLVEAGVQLPASRARHRELIDRSEEEVDLDEADTVLAVGGCVSDRESLARLERLAKTLGAAVATTRPLVEAGLMPSARLIGQSGQRVAPAIYLAMGVSGAAQHLAGIRSSGTIIAVNSDPDAQIFTIADYGVVADALAVADALDAWFARAQDQRKDSP